MNLAVKSTLDKADRARNAGTGVRGGMTGAARPVDDLQPAVGVLDQGSEALHPVARTSSAKT